MLLSRCHRCECEHGVNTPRVSICEAGPNGNAYPDVWSDVSDDWNPQSVFDLLANGEVRTILAAASIRPLSAEELCELTDVSLPTIYRRLNALVEYGLLSEEQTVGEDGRQFKRYETDLQELSVTVEDGDFNVNIELQKDAVDKFGELWSDLEEGRDRSDAPLDSEDVSIDMQRYASSTEFRGTDS